MTLPCRPRPGATGRWPARRRCAASRIGPNGVGRGRFTRFWPAAFIASFERPPEEIVLDIDATDDAVHGRQEGRFFHGYYDRYCFLPLYVFAGDHLLVAYLRPADIDPAKHAGAVLKLLIARLRRAWPGVRIVVRADSGFCRRRLMGWCERHGVGYILGLARNPRLAALVRPAMALAEAGFVDSGVKQRPLRRARLRSPQLGPPTPGDRPDRARPKGRQPALLWSPTWRATVGTSTSASTAPVARWRTASRNSSSSSSPTAPRATDGGPTSSACCSPASPTPCSTRSARRGLAGTEMARAQCATIRLKLLKVGAVITRNTRRVRFHLSSACPEQDLFRLVAARLKPG